MTAAIILAAGASTRLGRPKQLVTLGGETLLERALRTAHDAGCAPILAILGASHVEILCNTPLDAAIHIVNPGWHEGMASSIRLGIQTLIDIGQSQAPSSSPSEAPTGAILMTCDQPAVTPAHLLALMTTGRLTASAYAGRRGIPAHFPRSTFSALLQLHGDTGARTLLRNAPSIPLANGELDIDTAVDLAQAEAALSKLADTLQSSNTQTHESASRPISAGPLHPR